MSCSGDQHRFAPGSSACDCRETRSTLTEGGLPYPSWVLDVASRRGSRHSNTAQAVDGGTGRTYIVREYVPDAVADPQDQLRRFITVAKSLRRSPVRSERVLFAYTRKGRCYTVADPVPGTPVTALVGPGRTPEPECRVRLHALLFSLQQLHSAGGAAGPLFHGNLRLEDILASGSDPGASLDLLGSRYLDNLLRENPLPPEHFQQGDLTATADIVLAFCQGRGSSGDRAARLGRILDPLLGATLEYLYGLHGARASTAKAALDYLDLLERAASGPDRRLFQEATAISPSPRLLRFTVPPSPAPPPAPPQPRPQPAAAPPPPTPLPPASYIPYAPVATAGAPPHPSAARPAPYQAPRKKGSGCGGCLLTLVLILLVIGAIATALLNRPNAPTSLDFSADPNPAPYRARVQLQWTSSGLQRLELDGRRVNANGTLVVTANTSHRYTLAGVRPDGSREIREVELTVLPHRPAKPVRGRRPELSPDASTQTPDTVGNAAVH